MKLNQLKMGAILSYVQMALSMLVGIIYTPVMIRHLGQSEYGLYSVVSSTVSMLALLNLGLSSGYIRFYSKYKADDDEDNVAKLNGMYLLIFSVLGFVVLICGMLLSMNLDIVFDEGLTVSEYKLAKILFIVSTLNLSISFPMNTFVCILFAHEKFIFQRLIAMIKTVVTPLVMMPLLLIGYRSVAMVTVTLMLALLSDVISLFYCFKKLNVKFKFKNFEKGILKSLFSYTFFIAINMVVDQINTNSDKVLLGRFCGTVQVAIYAVGFSIFVYYTNFSTSISGVFTPRVHKIISSTKDDLQTQRRSITELFIKVGRIQYIILLLILTGLVFFGKTFIVKLWAGKGYEDSYIVLLCLAISATIPYIQNVGIEIQRAKNLHQFRSILYIGTTLLNLLLSIIFIKHFGAIGAPVGTAVAYLLGNSLVMNIFYHKKCNIDIIAFWKSILNLSKGLIIPIIFGILLLKYISINSLAMFVVMVFGYTLIYSLSMWFFGMNTQEKEIIKKPLDRIFHKLRKK